MAPLTSLAGVSVVCTVVAVFLQGCGSSSGGPTQAPAPEQTIKQIITQTTTTTAEPSPVAACMTDWGEDECCCQQCPNFLEGSAFSIISKDDCFRSGGQCKPRSEVFANSYYLRPPPAGLAHHSRRMRSVDGGSEQHHIIGGEPDEVTIVFIHPGPKALRSVELRVNGGDGQITVYGTSISTYSFFNNPQGWNGYAHSSRGSEFFDCVHSDGHPFYQNATCMYTSDIIHQAQVTGLMPDTAYDYRVQGEEVNWRTFTTAPAVGAPINIAVVADLGQSDDSVVTMQQMKESHEANEFDTVIFPGDLAYADGLAPAWDEYGRLSEFFFSSVPTAYTVGNHESTQGLENNVNFLPRYGWASSKTTSSSPLWFSYDAGLAHVIMLCSYCSTVAGSAQYVWLQQDLDGVNRTTTPWVVMAWHVPFYSSSIDHPMEDLSNPDAGWADGYQQRADLEQMIYDAKVDVVFQGHVHSYERTVPVFKNETTCDGPVYITIGDGGNHEGPACGWAGEFPWSAKKETSFGFGVLSIPNETDAEWVWHRNQNGSKVPADYVPLKIARTRCNATNFAVTMPVGAITV